MDFKVTHGDTFTFPVTYTLADAEGSPLDASGVSLTFNLKPALAAAEVFRRISVGGNADGTFPAISLGSTEALPPAVLYYELLFNRDGVEKTLLTGKLHLVTYAVDTTHSASTLTFTANNTPLQLVALPEAQAAGNYASEAKALRDEVVLLHGAVVGFETDFSNYLSDTQSARDAAVSAKDRVVAAQAQVATDAASTAADRTAVAAAAEQVATDAGQVSVDAAQVAADRSTSQALVGSLQGDLAKAVDGVETSAAFGVSTITSVAGTEQVRLYNAAAGYIQDIKDAGEQVAEGIVDSEQQALQAVIDQRTEALAAIDSQAGGHTEQIDAKKDEVLAAQNSLFTSHRAQMESHKNTLVAGIDSTASGHLAAMDGYLDKVEAAELDVTAAQEDVTGKLADVNTALTQTEDARDEAVDARDEVVADAGSTTSAMFAITAATTGAMTTLLAMLNKDDKA